MREDAEGLTLTAVSCWAVAAERAAVAMVTRRT